MKRYYLVGYRDDRPKEILHSEEYPYNIPGSNINYVSPGFPTLDELKQELGILEKPCKVCGGVVHTHCQLFGYFDKEVDQRNFCSTCNLWYNRLSQRTDPNIFIIDGMYYQDAGPSKNPKHSLGFAGLQFNIKTNDGKIVSTNNLWYGGTVPTAWKDAFPDTAVFISKEEVINQLQNLKT